MKTSLDGIKYLLDSFATIMNNDTELALLNNIAELTLTEIESNENIFIKIIDRIIYSCQENYFNNDGRNDLFLNWAANIEENTSSLEIRICIVEAIETFTNSLDEAKFYVTSTKGQQILLAD